MKTARAHPGDYRNDVVFRSAERLLASRPASRTKRVPRWALFAAGVALGLVVALALVLRVAQTPVQLGSAVVTTRLSPGPASPPATPVHRSPPASAPAAMVSAEPVTPPVSEAKSADASPASTLVRRSGAVLDEARQAAAHPGDVAYLDAVFATLSDVTLRGELSAPRRPALAVQFSLRRFGEAADISGRVDFFEQGRLTASRTVQGTLKGRTLALREVLPYAASPTSVPFGHRFAFTLPEKNSGGEIRGDWALGGVTGSAKLQLALPW